MSRCWCATLLAVVLVLPPGAPTGAAPPDALLREGVEAYLRGAPVHALADFTLAAHEAPRSALAALWAGVAAVAAGRMPEAAAWFRAALARPHSAAEAGVARAWLRRLAALAAPPAAAGRTWLEIAALARASNPRLTDAQARWVGQAVVAAARSAGIDPWLLASVVYVESRFNHASVSWAGAMGLGQLMPRTAEAAGVDARDPWGNLVGAARVLRWDYDEFRGWPLALAAYNAGSDAVRRWGGVPPYAETQWYVRAVLSVYAQLARGGA
jgi:soluble lytic murein transglycosylase-like protein